MKLILLSRRFFALLIILAGSIGIINKANASHTMGADLSYKCVGPNQYEVTLSFYRDCSGASDPGGCNYTFDSNCNVSGSSCQAPGTVYFYMLSKSCNQCIKDQFGAPASITDVTPICFSANNVCNGGTNKGVQQWIYKKVVTLPAQCTDWRFVYGNFARNSAITTLNQTSVGMYVEATLNNIAAPCNNSPEFLNRPVPWLCIGQNFCYNHGAVEADGDSLVYSLAAPQVDINGAIVSYKAGFTYQNPVTSNPAISFNTVNGDVCFTPTVAQVTVMAVKVSEYRNGVLIGSTVRDMQVTVLNCTNNSPIISGIGGTNSFADSVCAGKQICFNVNGSDPDAGDSVTMSWNNGISGGTFTVVNNGSQSPVGTFCWTPTASEIQAQPYTFTVLIKDNHCPYYSVQSKAFSVVVKSCGPAVVASADTTICRGSCATISATVVGGLPNYTYSWSNNAGTGSTAQVCPTVTTQYVVTVTDASGLTAQDSVTVNVNALPTISVSAPTGICNGASTTLTASGANTYSWTPGGMTGSSVTVSPSNTTSYTVTGTNAAGCSATASTTVTVNPVPVVAISKDTAVCAGSSVKLTASGGNTYNWSPGNTSGSSITVTPTSTTTYTVTVTGAGACTATASVTVPVNPMPVVTFTPFANSVCLTDAPFALTGGSPSGGTYSGNGVSGNMFDPNAAGVGTWTLTYNYTDPNGCSGSATASIIVDPAGTVTINSIASLCVNASPVTLSGSPAGGTFSGPGVSGNTFDPSIAGAGTHTITYTVSGSTRCLSNTSASTQVIVTAQPVINITTSPSLGCIANTFYVGYGNLKVTLTANVTGTVTSYQWYMNGVAIPGATNSTFDVNQSGWYNIIGTVNGCVSDSGGSGLNIVVVDVRCGHDTSKKVTICHVPDCRYDKQVTICISENAVPDHFRNHPCDCLGPCSTPHPNKRVANEADLSGIGFAAYPNPFSKETSLEFIVSDPNQTTLEIYDLKGVLISELFNGYAEEDFDYSLKVTGLSAGIYIAKLQSGDFSKHLKLIVAE